MRRHDNRDPALNDCGPLERSPHDAMNDRRPFVRIDSNNGVARSDKQPGIGAADAVPFVGMKGLSCNPPSEVLRHRGEKCPLECRTPSSQLGS
jgi:hypothetical protein